MANTDEARLREREALDRFFARATGQVDGNVVAMSAHKDKVSKAKQAQLEQLVASQLSTSMVAERLGVSPATVRRYMVSDRHEGFPAPDGRLEVTPWWWEWTIDAWVASRPGRGAGGGRPKKPVEPEAVAE